MNNDLRNYLYERTSRPRPLPMSLNIVVLFPAFTRHFANQHLVHNRIVHDLLRVAVEHDLAVHALCQHAETEYLAQRTCDRERRTGLFLALSSQ